MCKDGANNYSRTSLHCFVAAATDVISPCSRFSQLAESIPHKDKLPRCQPASQELRYMNAAEVTV